jgi:flagellin-like protein
MNLYTIVYIIIKKRKKLALKRQSIKRLKIVNTNNNKMMNDKRGISALVATVLLILITVAAVGIIWVAVRPMVSVNLQSSQACSDAAMSLKVDSTSGYTFFNTASNETNVMVSRGADTLNLAGLQIVASGASGTNAFEIRQGANKTNVRLSGDLHYAGNFTDADIPVSNGAVTYILDTSSMGRPDKVAVSAIVKSGSSEKLCGPSAAVTLVDSTSENIPRGLPQNNFVVGFWNFDEGTGTTAADAANNGNGTISATGTTWTSPGKIGGYDLTFGGSSGFVNFSSKEAWNLTDALTISGWFSLSSANAGGKSLFYKSYASNTQYDYMMYLGSTGLVSIKFNSSAGTAFSAGTSVDMRDGQWHLFTGTFDGNNLSFYVDGDLKNTTAATGQTIRFSDQPLYLFTGWSSAYVKGTADEVVIWNKALTADEVKMLYAGGNPTRTLYSLP